MGFGKGLKNMDFAVVVASFLSALKPGLLLPEYTPFSHPPHVIVIYWTSVGVPLIY